MEQKAGVDWLKWESETERTGFGGAERLSKLVIAEKRG